jgi:tetratricopeptide (TPR) repeat protein
MRQLLVVLMLLAPCAFAEVAVPLPEAGVSYTDGDPAAIAWHPGPGQNARFRRDLNTTIRANPRDTNALLHRAFLFHASGDIEEGDRDFLRVLELTRENDPVRHRRALWSLGWSAYGRGQAGEAIAFWQRAAELHGGHPYWYSYTIAVGAWTLGDQAAALAWYEMAVRSNPEWGSDAGLRERTRRWREPERLAVEALFKAWSQRPAPVAGPPVP